MESIDYTIVGGGVIGLAIGYYLTQQYPSKTVALFEKNKYLGEEQSGRNSGVLHAGHLYRNGSWKARLCLRGNRMLAQFARENDIPYLQTGKMTVATTEEEEKTLDFYLQQAWMNGVDTARKIGSEWLQAREPNVQGRAALYTPTTGIIDAAVYVRMLESFFTKQGGDLFREAEIIGVRAEEKKSRITVRQQGREYDFETEFVVNAAGLGGERVGKMINPNFPYVIKPHRGDYLKFNQKQREDLWMKGMNVYPMPRPIPGMFNQDGKPKMMVGTHLTPVFEYDAEGKVLLGKTVLVGPLANQTGQPLPKARFLEDILPFFPGLREDDLEEEMTGIQVKLAGYDDFVIERDRKYRNCLHVIADSPGLTASLAIAEEAVKLMKR